MTGNDIGQKGDLCPRKQNGEKEGITLDRGRQSRKGGNGPGQSNNTTEKKKKRGTLEEKILQKRVTKRKETCTPGVEGNTIHGEGN